MNTLFFFEQPTVLACIWLAIAIVSALSGNLPWTLTSIVLSSMWSATATIIRNLNEIGARL